MANWEDEFVPRSVKDNIVLGLFNHSKYKDYMHNLNENNLENNIYAVILDCNKLQSSLLSGCVFSNIDRTCHYPILKLISAINNLPNDYSKKIKPLIVYSANDHPTYLND